MNAEKIRYIADNIAHAYETDHSMLQNVDELADEIKEYVDEYDRGWRLSSDEKSYISPSGSVIRKI